jgi:hypothetical protein
VIEFDGDWAEEGTVSARVDLCGSNQLEAGEKRVWGN